MCIYRYTHTYIYILYGDIITVRGQVQGSRSRSQTMVNLFTNLGTVFEHKAGAAPVKRSSKFESKNRRRDDPRKFVGHWRFEKSNAGFPATSLFSVFSPREIKFQKKNYQKQYELVKGLCGLCSLCGGRAFRHSSSSERIRVPSWAPNTLMPSLWLVKVSDCSETGVPLQAPFSLHFQVTVMEKTENQQAALRGFHQTDRI